MPQRDSFIFYRSFYEASKALGPKQKLQLYDAIFTYALDFKEPTVSGVVSSLWELVRPNLEANSKRYLNGTKGATHGKLGASFGKLGGRPRVEKPPKNPPHNPPNKDKDKDKDVDVNGGLVAAVKFNEESYVGALLHTLNLTGKSAAELVTEWRLHHDAKKTKIKNPKLSLQRWIKNSESYGHLKKKKTFDERIMESLQ